MRSDATERVSRVRRQPPERHWYPQPGPWTQSDDSPREAVVPSRGHWAMSEAIVGCHSRLQSLPAATKGTGGKGGEGTGNSIIEQTSPGPSWARRDTNKAGES